MLIGSILGETAGQVGGQALGEAWAGGPGLTSNIMGVAGGVGGAAAGMAFPFFKHGGRVGGPGSRIGQPRLIVAHNGEYVLSANNPPSRQQIAITAQNKRKAAKKPAAKRKPTVKRKAPTKKRK